MTRSRDVLLGLNHLHKAEVQENLHELCTFQPGRVQRVTEGAVLLEEPKQLLIDLIQVDLKFVLPLLHLHLPLHLIFLELLRLLVQIVHQQLA